MDRLLNHCNPETARIARNGINRETRHPETAHSSFRGRAERDGNGTNQIGTINLIAKGRPAGASSSAKLLRGIK
jgi:hypothetical protein